jgi:hypothetical protein
MPEAPRTRRTSAKHGTPFFRWTGAAALSQNAIAHIQEKGAW